MLLGVIADDFTGAGDIANTLAKGLRPGRGLRTAQFLGVPKRPSSADVEAGVVALKSRSIPASDAVAQSLEALDWLLAQGARQIVFKYCSTFDSTPEGNIGAVAEALAGSLGSHGVVVCPAFPAMRRTIYQGHLFVGDRLLSESSLRHHPLNPMTDPDIRRWLRKQSESPIGHVAWETVRHGANSIASALHEEAAAGRRLVVVDALCDDDLIALGSAVSNAKLVTGGSGVAMALPENFIMNGLATGSAPQAVGIDGPEAILAGSCSGATRAQIEYHRRDHPCLAIDVDNVMNGTLNAKPVSEFLLSHSGKLPLAFSSNTPEEVGRLQARYGREAVALALDEVFAQVARNLVAAGVRRLVVAGGETSGAIVSALDLGALTIGPEIDEGVPILVSAGDTPIGFALKSGNFGSPDFFNKAIRKLAGQ
jgi:3-dehydrotetronate 4-kinase